MGEPLPAWVDKDAFEGWLAMRKAKKVPWSHRCLQRALKRLQDLKDKGHDPNQALEDAEYNGWTDVWVPKDRTIGYSQAGEARLRAEREQERPIHTPEAIKAREACRAALKLIPR